jgi:group I intron endonuclease
MLDEILSTKLVNKSGIYSIVNASNGKIYIGSAKKINTRINAHKNMLKRNKHYNTYLQNAYNKHGVFVYSIVELCEESDLSSREQFYIDKYNSCDENAGYNLAKIVEARSYPTDITRKKISDNRRGKGLRPKEYCNCGLKYTVTDKGINRCRPCFNKKQKEKRAIEREKNGDLRETKDFCRAGHSYLENPPIFKANPSRGGKLSKVCQLCVKEAKTKYYLKTRKGNING